MSANGMSYSILSFFSTAIEIINSVRVRSRDVFTFLTVSSIFVGATGFFQTFMGYILLGATPNPLICMAVFLITFSTYSLNKLTDMAEDSINVPERINFIYGRKQFILITALGSYLLSIPLVFFAAPLAVPIVFVPILANLLYGSKLLPGIPRLKDIPVMKNVIVAISWALVCTLLPSVEISNVPMATILLVLYFMLVKVFINTILYDIRDVEGDRVAGVKTIPSLLNTPRTTMLLLVINSALTGILAFINQPIRSLLMAMILYGYFCIIYFRKRRNPLILDLFADGEWMFFSILYNLFRLKLLYF